MFLFKAVINTGTSKTSLFSFCNFPGLVRKINLAPNVIVPIRSPLGSTPPGYDNDQYMEVLIYGPRSTKIIFNIKRMSVDSNDDYAHFGNGDTTNSNKFLDDTQVQQDAMYAADQSTAWFLFASGGDGISGDGLLVEVFTMEEEGEEGKRSTSFRRNLSKN